MLIEKRLWYRTRWTFHICLFHVLQRLWTFTAWPHEVFWQPAPDPFLYHRILTCPLIEHKIIFVTPVYFLSQYLRSPLFAPLQNSVCRVLQTTRRTKCNFRILMLSDVCLRMRNIHSPSVRPCPNALLSFRAMPKIRRAETSASTIEGETYGFILLYSTSTKESEKYLSGRWPSPVGFISSG